MTASMISFETGEWRFNLRAAAVVRNGDFVLLHRIPGDSFRALPCGRVEKWFHARDSGSMDLQPSFLKGLLTTESGMGTRHVVHDDPR